MNLNTVSSLWPLPAQIPWDQVDIESWSLACAAQPFEGSDDSNTFYSEFASHYENSLSGFSNVPGEKLHPMHCGRAQRMKPVKQTLTPLSVKASRPGELSLRSDLIGVAVLNWFRQLRRIQSYVHSIAAGKMHPCAVQYRSDLWTSILFAKGFQNGFSTWWKTEGFDSLLGPLPTSPPSHEPAQWILAAFHAAFRQFEAWHLNKKQQIIQSKYDKSFKAIYRDLRAPKPDQIDTLWTHQSYVALAVRPSSKTALLDQSIEIPPGGIWLVDGCQVQVKGTLEELIVFDEWPELLVGTTLVYQSHTKSDEEAHQKLLEVWQPRWQRSIGVDDSILERAMNFVQNFVPKLNFELNDITPNEWYKTVARLKPQAARGPDGYARLDLLKMPVFYVQILIKFLMDIELNNREWPQQMTLGFVLALAKHPDAHTADAYCPIVLLSMVYRIWGSLRRRQLLRMIEACIHDNAHGFLPGRETMQSWLQIQACIETAIQSGFALSGLATDLKKAFNNAQRPQWFLLAERLGIPQRILCPWRRFLQVFHRRFQVHRNLSDEVYSNVGFAEGDPLSVFGMALIDWSRHIYMDALAPPIKTLTFVDNISLLSTDIGNLTLGFFALQAFLQLWGLDIDVLKSCCWSTTAALRPLLGQLGLQVVSDATELGGSLTLGASRRVRLLLERGHQLNQKWMRLRVSKAPLSQKIARLPLAFWPAALHGSLGCVFSPEHLHKLRKTAIQSLGLRCGGSNPQLRLALSGNMKADPGFYHLRSYIFDFRRLTLKCPDLVQMWRFFMLRYDGKPTVGPFYKLVGLFSQIGWSLSDVPKFLDHDGCEHDLLMLPNAALELLLEDAWLQGVSHKVRHRASMRDLCGIDGELAFFDRPNLTAGDLGRALALQTGAFISGWQHAKYDATKDAVCPTCLAPATQQHWFRCPKYAALRADCGDMLRWVDHAPACLQQHLLVPRSPVSVELKQHFLSLEDSVEVFLSPPSNGPQLFSKETTAH